MKNTDTVLLIKINNNATLRVRKDKIVAMVSGDKPGVTDLYVEGIGLPWHIPDDATPTNALIGLVWGGDDD